MTVPTHRSNIRKKYFYVCLAELLDGQLIIGEVAKDGLIYIFSNDIEETLNKNYPSDRFGWYFNSSKDRYIAEREAEGISVNPQFVTKHCKTVLVQEDN